MWKDTVRGLIKTKIDIVIVMRMGPRKLRKDVISLK